MTTLAYQRHAAEAQVRVHAARPKLVISLKLTSCRHCAFDYHRWNAAPYGGPNFKAMHGLHLLQVTGIRGVKKCISV
jgi:hypothetical protein